MEEPRRWPGCKARGWRAPRGPPHPTEAQRGHGPGCGHTASLCPKAMGGGRKPESPGASAILLKALGKAPILPGACFSICKMAADKSPVYFKHFQWLNFHLFFKQNHSRDPQNIKNKERKMQPSCSWSIQHMPRDHRSSVLHRSLLELRQEHGGRRGARSHSQHGIQVLCLWGATPLPLH